MIRFVARITELIWPEWQGRLCDKSHVTMHRPNVEIIDFITNLRPNPSPSHAAVRSRRLFEVHLFLGGTAALTEVPVDPYHALFLAAREKISSRFGKRNQGSISSQMPATGPSCYRTRNSSHAIETPSIPYSALCESDVDYLKQFQPKVSS